MKIAVFCGSNIGNNKIYETKAKELGLFFAKNGIGLVYGGGGVGLMGAIAQSVMDNNGEAFGVIPKHLKDKELAHEGLSALHVVDDMHARKNMMSSHADAFIAMPGGAGTMEEIFEVWTWMQIGYHKKACAFYNVNGFYDKLFEFLEHMVKEGFLQDVYLKSLIIENSPEKIYEAIKNYNPPKSKWDK